MRVPFLPLWIDDFSNRHSYSKHTQQHQNNNSNNIGDTSSENDDLFFDCSNSLAYHCLTHFHTDHTDGIHSSWSDGIIFCSPVTKALLLDSFPRIPSWRVVALPFGETFRVPITVSTSTLIQNLKLSNACAPFSPTNLNLRTTTTTNSFSQSSSKTRKKFSSQQQNNFEEEKEDEGAKNLIESIIVSKKDLKQNQNNNNTKNVTTTPPNKNYFDITLIPAAHIPGAAMCIIDYPSIDDDNEEDDENEQQQNQNQNRNRNRNNKNNNWMKRILFTGDFRIDGTNWLNSTFSNNNNNNYNYASYNNNNSMTPAVDFLCDFINETQKPVDVLYMDTTWLHLKSSSSSSSSFGTKPNHNLLTCQELSNVFHSIVITIQAEIRLRQIQKQEQEQEESKKRREREREREKNKNNRSEQKEEQQENYDNNQEDNNNNNNNNKILEFGNTLQIKDGDAELEYLVEERIISEEQELEEKEENASASAAAAISSYIKRVPIKMRCQVVDSATERQPFVLKCYLHSHFGKEVLLQELARQFRTTIGVDSRRYRILKAVARAQQQEKQQLEQQQQVSDDDDEEQQQKQQEKGNQNTSYYYSRVARQLMQQWHLSCIDIQVDIKLFECMDTVHNRSVVAGLLDKTSSSSNSNSNDDGGQKKQQQQNNFSSRCCIHIVSNRKECDPYVLFQQENETKIPHFGLFLSGWSSLKKHLVRFANNNNFDSNNNNNNSTTAKVWAVPFSLHSSRSELEYFVSRLRPASVFPLSGHSKIIRPFTSTSSTSSSSTFSNNNNNNSSFLSSSDSTTTSTFDLVNGLQKEKQNRAFRCMQQYLYPLLREPGVNRMIPTRLLSIPQQRNNNNNNTLSFLQNSQQQQQEKTTTARIASLIGNHQNNTNNNSQEQQQTELLQRQLRRAQRDKDIAEAYLYDPTIALVNTIQIVEKKKKHLIGLKFAACSDSEEEDENDSNNNNNYNNNVQQQQQQEEEEFFDEEFEEDEDEEVADDNVNRKFSQEKIATTLQQKRRSREEEEKEDEERRDQVVEHKRESQLESYNKLFDHFDEIEF